MTSKAFGLAQLGNAYSDGALSNRNKIINGGFDVWQRGTSFSSASVNEYSADRFRTEGFGLSTTISRQSFTAGQTDVPDFPTYFCRVATSATVGSGQYWSFQQRLEVPQVVSQGQTYTLSFWVRATSGTISADTLSYGFSTGLVGFSELTTTWQKVTRTLVFGASQISGSYASAYLVYAPENTAAFSVDIANVQLEAGDTATPFEHRSYGAELALCQRYFTSSFPDGTAVANGVTGPALEGPASAFATDDVYCQEVSYSVPMRASPTITYYNMAGTSGVSGKWATYDLVWTAVTTTATGAANNKGFTPYMARSGAFVRLNSYLYSGHYSASAEL